MVLAALILVLSTGMFFFYLQATCQKILRRKFEQDFSKAIVHANHLEFPAILEALQDSSPAVNLPRLRAVLKCDFLALAYLLKNSANVTQRYSREERLLILYFRLIFLSLTARHWLRGREKPAILKLAAILQYFANVIGQRVDSVRFGNLTATEYLLRF